MRAGENLQDTRGETSVHAVGWASTKIHRVVRSTLAAEAARASHAQDRGTYVRVLLAELFCSAESPRHWTDVQRDVQYLLTTDCHSLFEHCRKASRARRQSVD